MKTAFQTLLLLLATPLLRGEAPSATAPAVLARMASAYASAAAYSDRGEVDAGDPLGMRVFQWVMRGSDHDTFATKFSRASGLMFTYYGSRTQTWRARSVSETKELAGVTHESSRIVPPLLLPSRGQWSVADLQDVRLSAPRRVRDRSCYVLIGRRGLRTYELSIDRLTFLLLRVDIDGTRIDYHPDFVTHR